VTDCYEVERSVLTTINEDVIFYVIGKITGGIGYGLYLLGRCSCCKVTVHVDTAVLTSQAAPWADNTAIQGGSKNSKLLTISVFSVSQGSVEALIR